ncbi:hypothetical protein [Pollutimonas sp. M17]|uniref:hypothetical protein n=1 Tax=Pollutimonas sp. M17 TaxID=2962065 RepID=UPI0021F4B537|nr:hypothetical protein [Pollutimonas sp. M17]UYO94667.1 hypothetical protein OEG81_04905 [Pollutimonas sp. M17]HWK69469.1 hypothetical protein [Burkholderiaceae bacterium]
MNNSGTTKNGEEPPTPFPTSQDNPAGHEEALDSGLEETFPASDPVSITTKKPDTDAPDATGAEPRKAAGQKEENLDEGLEETFPASDPVSITTKKPEDPAS